MSQECKCGSGPLKPPCEYVSDQTLIFYLVSSSHFVTHLYSDQFFYHYKDVSATSVEFTFTNIEFSEQYKNRNSTKFKEIENKVNAMVSCKNITKLLELCIIFSRSYFGPFNPLKTAKPFWISYELF